MRVPLRRQRLRALLMLERSAGVTRLAEWSMSDGPSRDGVHTPSGPLLEPVAITSPTARSSSGPPESTGGPGPSTRASPAGEPRRPHPSSQAFGE
jgi:hypothetical protein